MVFLRTIILQLILPICLVFSQDDFIHIEVFDTKSPIYFDAWITENLQFYLLIESNHHIKDSIICSYGHGTEIKLHKEIISSKHHFYASNYITASQDMYRQWICSGYFQGFTALSREFFDLPSLVIKIDMRVDVNECNNIPWPCGSNAECTNTIEGYKCTCLPGFEGDGVLCEDVNECLSNPCPDHAECFNEAPGFRCSCRPGFTADRNTCSDVDECSAIPQWCSPYANCTNKIGDYECTCLFGYAGNGTYCEGISVVDEGGYLKLVVVIVVTVAVVAAVVWLMVGLYKRRQRREKAMQSELNYQTLENTTDRPMPTPVQWDNYPAPDRQNENDTDTYSVPYPERNIEDMYAKPQPKALRKPPNETLHAELSFASDELKGENPTYGNLSHQTADNCQIQAKILNGNPNTSKVTPTERLYAMVLPKSMRPNKESTYENVLDTQRYVNSENGGASRDRGEYAEPAYCEIGFKK